ncbi:hypothetical protein [Acidimangrovimonas pyrenivorans]|uniref:Uncharacterized protein n=1 Tax=Acidimangrovimonas pyrenivorans TaxID=2030798 RepID=A0ABV7AJA4_9RHOB
MGGAKRAMMEHEDNLAAATGYLVDKGALEFCEFHGLAYGGGYSDLDSDFYRFAMADRNRGENGPVPWAAELEAREYTDVLKEAYEEHAADECYACAKNMAD